ncbi:MAG: GrpB family protein [Actinomycetota bacterium]|nr:GrpB family protein [Actinomycetota bacterium]
MAFAWSRTRSVRGSPPAGNRARTEVASRQREQPRWQQVLGFWDVLRAGPDLAGAYAELKRRLAYQHRDDVRGYFAARPNSLKLSCWTSITPGSIGWRGPPRSNGEEQVALPRGSHGVCTANWRSMRRLAGHGRRAAANDGRVPASRRDAGPARRATRGRPRQGLPLD